MEEAAARISLQMQLGLGHPPMHVEMTPALHQQGLLAPSPSMHGNQRQGSAPKGNRGLEGDRQHPQKSQPSPISLAALVLQAQPTLWAGKLPRAQEMDVFK